MRSPATYTWSAERAVSGGEPAQSSSISRSVADDAIRLQQEQGEHRALLARPELEPDAVAFCFERPEQPKTKFAH